MASLREADLVAILGADYARKVQMEMESKPTTDIERQEKRQREMARITDIRISLTGAILAGLGLLIGPFVLKSGLNIQAMCGVALIVIGVAGLLFTAMRKRTLRAEMAGQGDGRSVLHPS